MSSDAAGGRSHSTRDSLYRYVSGTVMRLQGASLDPGHHQHALARAQLAKLRRAKENEPGDPDTWQIVFDGMPEELHGTSDLPSRTEAAAHAALVLFARHVQSAGRPVHIQGPTVGAAVREIAHAQREESPQDAPVMRRFHSFAVASEEGQRLAHLRGLVDLMRANDVALDYGRLAADLYRCGFPDGLRSARLAWGRDLHWGTRRRTTDSATSAGAAQNDTTDTADTTIRTTTTEEN